ncbi:DUF2142 domain-containing protein [Leifsonia sp. 2MCAF36]|uniref:DUF2142 domain-containing protein n=1 Tax=Leifsonia sp. 2MCAF36 TaxID=3232988 RepID=UPI003F9C61BD
MTTTVNDYPASTRRPLKRLTSPRSSFWISFVLFFLVIGSWSVANPMMASPDEPAHAVKAAATVRGEFAADESAYNPGRGVFAVPQLFTDVWALPCFAFKAKELANCSPTLTGDLGAPSESVSHVARYNPLYYAIIGIPSLFPISTFTLVAMRLVGALLVALLAAFACRTIAELRRPGWPMVGFAAAVTPMTIFIASAMTPQGPEIFGAMATAIILLALVFEPDPDLLRRRLWRLVVVSGFFVLARGLSPVYLVLIVLLVLLVAPKFGVVKDLIMNRRAWLPLAVCVAVSLAAVIYILTAGSLALGVVYPDPNLTAPTVVQAMLSKTDYYVEQLLGVFGWGEVHLPLVAQLVIGGAVMVVAVIGFAIARLRGRLVLLGLVLLIVALPIGVQLASFKESGLIWQGKYILPLAVMVPLIAGFLAERYPMPAFLGRRVVPVVVPLLALAQIVAFVINLHRYINGANGPWTHLVRGAWHPGTDVWVATVIELVGWLALACYAVYAFHLRAQDRALPDRIERHA